MVDLFAAPQAAEVRDTEDLRRIVALPRRDSQQGIDELTEQLTAILRHEHGEQRLRPVQALALHDLAAAEGLFGIIPVGGGKTLISALAPLVVQAQRPLLFVPAALVGKTERAFKILRYHWPVPYIRVESYQKLGRISGADLLDRFQPDLVICDEGHRLKNRKAAVTRRVARYVRERNPVMCIMSGTVTKRSLQDYGHLMVWALGEQAPVPVVRNVLDTWADALDERKMQQRKARPGALIQLANEEEKKMWRRNPKRAARQAFQRRLVETQGVVYSLTSDVSASLTIRAQELPAAPALLKAFEKLRTYETPDSWPIADGLGMFRHARELALGFYYRWDPRPPDDWLEARRAWAAYVRQVLKRSRTLDSELQVRNAIHPENCLKCKLLAIRPDIVPAWVATSVPERCAAWLVKHKDKFAAHQKYEHWDEHLCDEDDSEGLKALRAWLAIRDTFHPNTVPVWVDTSVAEWCAGWLAKHKGIVWTEHACFGERVAALSGRSYYGQLGNDSTGRSIESADTSKGLIASIAANSTGRNLQAWQHGLITSMPPNNLQTEQLLGRQHREGTEYDEVHYTVLMNCIEHCAAFWQAKRDAEYVRDTTGAPQKILLADCEVPSLDEASCRLGPRWEKD